MKYVFYIERDRGNGFAGFLALKPATPRDVEEVVKPKTFERVTFHGAWNLQVNDCFLFARSRSQHVISLNLPF